MFFGTDSLVFNLVEIIWKDLTLTQKFQCTAAQLGFRLLYELREAVNKPRPYRQISGTRSADSSGTAQRRGVLVRSRAARPGQSRSRRCITPPARLPPASVAADPTTRAPAPGNAAGNRAESAGSVSASGSSSRIDAFLKRVVLPECHTKDGALAGSDFCQHTRALRGGVS